ncbi:hypothetical protein HYG89_11890 [Acinetobacter sp. SwsAc5]|uniref:hypothetical protein n=1 Tax=Acinetobacter sp. SwsAc5 TaxID=2749438 RepID=UPI0015BEB8F0|nr:hypothetical protein [Acinetobacter sp. SwsAc5]NWK53234.1 hypothetical protein [Acinetobacter sp. SwsAc5]
MDHTCVTLEVPTALVELTVEALKQFDHKPIYDLSSGFIQPPITEILLENVCRGDVSDELEFLEKYSIPYSCHVEPDPNIPEAHYHLRHADDGTPIKKVYFGSPHHLEIHDVQKLLENAESEAALREGLESLIEKTKQPEW